MDAVGSLFAAFKLVWFGLGQIAFFIYGVAVELFQREKLGQCCSAQALFYQLLMNLVNPLLIAPFFDWIHDNRLGYLWSALFYFLAVAVSFKVYRNWLGRQKMTTIAFSQRTA